MGVIKLNVNINFSEQKQLVGQLVKDGKRILFKYSSGYVANGANISPLKIVFDTQVQGASIEPFDGLFGVFADSLPDAWGRLILKKKLRSKGVALETYSQLDYLASLGGNSLGALTYEPSKVSGDETATAVDLDFLNTSAQNILKGNTEIVIDGIFNRGGSPGGARPKIYASYHSKLDELAYGSSQSEEGFEDWIIKFAATNDANDIANIELAYYYMALDAGLEMATSQVFIGASGKKYFGTKRFDRIGNNRLHMISASGLLHDDYQYSQLDYGTLLHEGLTLVGSAKVHEQILRQAAFNIFAHNRDDHSKNFAFLMNSEGDWSFAPSYDLTFSSSSQGEHSTTCAGNGKNPGKKELLELSSYFSIRNGSKIIEQVRDVVSSWNQYAVKAAVTTKSKVAIKKVLDIIV